MDSKPSYLSKTLWLNAIIAVCALVAPGAAQFISSHAVEVGIAIPVINILLRLVSSGKIELY